MVAYFCWGGADKSALYSGANVFSDIGSYNWAKGSINFGYNAGYISGAGTDANGKLIYNPAGAVKGSELAKTLLVVLGYKADAKDAAYALVGSNWELNSIRLAEQEGLFANLSASFNPTAALTREEAAQIFTNLLKKGYTYTEYNEDGTPVKSSHDDGPMDKYFAVWGAATSGSDDLGRPTKSYTNSASKKTINVSVDPVATFTTATKEAAVKAALATCKNTAPGANGALNTTASLKAVVNSAAAQDTTTNAATTYAEIAGLTGNGKIVEVYDKDNDAQVDAVVVIAPTFGAATVTAKAATKSKGAYTQYSIDSVTGSVYSTVVNADADVSDAVVTGTIADKDWALYYQGANNKYFEAVSTVDGVLSSISSNNVYTIGGKAYPKAAATGGTFPAAVKKDSASYYVDSFGNLLGAVATQEAGTRYAYVVTTEVVNTLVGTTIKPAYSATVINADGTTETLTTAADQTSLKGKMVTVAQNAKTGLYTLTELTATKVDGTEGTTRWDKTGTAVVNKATKITTANTLVNNKTVFVVVNYTKDAQDQDVYSSVTVYNGINAVPNLSATAGKIHSLDTTKAADAIADLVVVDDASAANTSKNAYVYVIGTYSVTADGYVYDVIKDGELTTITVSHKMAQIDGADPAHVLCSDITDNGSDVTPTKATETTKAIQNIGGLLYVGANKAGLAQSANYGGVIEDNVPVYTIDLSDDTVVTSTAASLDKAVEGSVVLVAKSTSDPVTAVFILVP